MKKRGMISQPFIYIFMIIVIALILVFGFNMIGKLGKLNEQTVYLTFKGDFKKSVDSMYYKNPGSVLVYSKTSRNNPLMVPSDIEEVCFEDGNILLNSETYYDFTSDSLIVTNNILCIDTNGELSYKLENVVISGETYVKISSI